MQSRAAIRYAKAIYEIALEENSIKELYNDMDIIKSIYFDSLDFKNLLSNSLSGTSHSNTTFLSFKMCPHSF